MIFSKIKVDLLSSYIPFEENTSLSNCTAFSIGGPTPLLIKPQDKYQLINALKACHSQNLIPIVLGKGSNVLIKDEGVSSPVILIASNLYHIELCEAEITALAGVTLAQLCIFAREHSLSGLEWAYGIPGAVGGSVYMNAGAYGSEMKNVVTSVTTITLKGEVKIYSKDECDFSYRHSCFMSNNEVILDATFALKKGEEKQITQAMTNTLNSRRENQPLEYPCAGSTFKRPAGGFASQLIDECGLKGRSVGGAQVSVKHAGFVINTGGATCKDVLELCAIIKDTVYSQKGIMLELEVELI